MFTLSVETHFWASHQLAKPGGLREPLHRHNWSVSAEVSSSNVNKLGLVMDFRRLKEMVDSIVAEFDNQPLDSIAFFRRNNSSAESVAKYIYQKLEPQLPKGVKLQAVRVVEESGCSVKFEESD
ncbi:MAG: 6-pyruvoyl trahydropterin synthase family protein [Planctomycetota bacterium]